MNSTNACLPIPKGIRYYPNVLWIDKEGYHITPGREPFKYRSHIG
jgi:hypothetical protein